MTMEDIESIFAQHFQNWDIRLRSEDVEARQSGKLSQAGWNIEYLFGTDGDSEYLDYYATHRMTNDRHVRIYSSGKTESLETPQEFRVFPAEADEATRQKITDDYQAHNRAIYERLREKGFLSPPVDADPSGWEEDSPLGESDLTPEQREWLDMRNMATRIFDETGDSTMGEDIGLFPRRPRRMWSHVGRLFHVVRKSEDAVYIGLRCPTHFHKIFIIGLLEDETELIIGRPAEGDPKYSVNSLEEALEVGADLLLQECPSGFRKQLNDFFDVEEEEEFEV